MSFRTVSPATYFRASLLGDTDGSGWPMTIDEFALEVQILRLLPNSRLRYPGR